MKPAWLNWFSRRGGPRLSQAGAAAMSARTFSTEAATRSPEPSQRGVGAAGLPRPALHWVGPMGRIALRELDFEADVDAVCSFQEETYVSNFSDFRYTDSFAAAFRHDLRRASLDPQHGLYVLDDGNVQGFLWLVVCQNTWTGERYGYVNNLYVSPARRGCGLAADLMRQADSFFRSRHIKRIRLTVTAENETACRLYARGGYEVTRWEMEKEI